MFVLMLPTRDSEYKGTQKKLYTITLNHYLP